MQGSDTLIGDSPRIQAWMHDRSGLPIQRDFHGIARQRNGHIVAAFGYDSFQPAGCQMHLCVDALDGINRALLLRAFQVPFIQWNYQYLVAIIQASNLKSLNMARRLGYTSVGEIAGHLGFFVMKREDCRWLKLPERTQ